MQFAGRALVLVVLTWLSIADAWADGPLKVVTSTSDLAALTQEIGGNAVDVTCLAPPSVDPHRVPVKPSMIRAVKDAELVMVIGKDHDSWFDEILAASDNPKVQKGQPGFLETYEGIELIKGMKRVLVDDKVPLHMHKSGNTHYWLDPRNAKTMGETIAKRLGEMRPAEAAALRSRAAGFFAGLDAHIDDWKKRLGPLAGVSMIAYHDTWAYLEQFGKFEIVGMMESSPGVAPSPSHLAALTQLMKDRGTKIILMADYEDRGRAEALANDTGARIVQVGPSVPGGETFQEHFEKIVKALEEVIAHK